MKINKEETEEILYTVEGNCELLELRCRSLRNDSRWNIPDVIFIIKEDMDKKGVRVFLDEFLIEEDFKEDQIAYGLTGCVEWNSLPFDKKVIKRETFFRYKNGRFEYVLKITT